MKKLLSIIFSLSIIFTMCTSSLRAFSFSYSFNLEKAISNLYYPCKDENSEFSIISCKDKNLTYEKISNMSLDDFKEKYKDARSNRDLNEIYALSKLKSGERHVTIHDNNIHYEYFRVSAVDEILNFFKTKFNYEQRDYKRDLFKSIAKLGIIGSIFGGICSYIGSLFDNTKKAKNKKADNEAAQKNNKEKSNNGKNKFSKFIDRYFCPIIKGFIGACTGWGIAYFDYLNAEETYRDQKDDVLFALSKSNYGTDYWKDNDVLMFEINRNDGGRSGASYRYHNIGLGYSEDEQEVINKEYETLHERASDAMLNLTAEEKKKLKEIVESIMEDLANKEKTSSEAKS